MDAEQRKHRAWRSVIQEDEGQGDIEYLVEVSGDRVELHQIYDEQWDNEDGTGKDVHHDVWVMRKDILKELIKVMQWCIDKSEQFEAKRLKEIDNDATI